MAKYSKALCKKLEKEFANGATIEVACNNVGISEAIFYRWKAAGKVELLEAIKKGREKSIDRAENAFYKRVIGYSYVEETVIVDTENNKKELEKLFKNKDKIKVKKTTKQVLPDVVAGIFYLKNMRPEKWKDKHNVDFSGEIGVQIIDDIK